MAESVQNRVLNNANDTQNILLRSIAEQLKTPMMYIARQAELSHLAETALPQTFLNMQSNADMALRLIDSYILGLELSEKQMSLELEPVSLSSVLYDVAHDLTPLAKQRNTDIELVLAGKYGQVMANTQGLVAAFYSLGSVLSEACAEENSRGRLRIAAHRSTRGVVAGMYLDGIPSLQTTIHGARKLRHSFTRQPFAKLTAGTGAGIFIADTILSCMDVRLRAGKFHGKHGMAATLQPSRQLQLI